MRGAVIPEHQPPLSACEGNLGARSHTARGPSWTALETPPSIWLTSAATGCSPAS